MSFFDLQKKEEVKIGQSSQSLTPFQLNHKPSERYVDPHKNVKQKNETKKSLLLSSSLSDISPLIEVGSDLPASNVSKSFNVSTMTDPPPVEKEKPAKIEQEFSQDMLNREIKPKAKYESKKKPKSVQNIHKSSLNTQPGHHQPKLPGTLNDFVHHEVGLLKLPPFFILKMISINLFSENQSVVRTS